MTPQDALTKLLARGRTYRDIARELGVNHSQTVRWHQGNQEPAWSTGQRVIALAKASGRRR